MTKSAAGIEEPLAQISVVINSFGRAKHFVERAADSFLRQKHRPGKIHFIDQNETPLVLARRFLTEPRFEHHHRPDPICSNARNAALELVQSGWIAFSDDDGHWADDYSERLVELLSNEPELELIAGSMIDESNGQYYTLRHRIGGKLATFTGTKLLYGANFLIRAEIFARVGGYDPRLGPGTYWPSSEEADLCWRVVSSGARARFAPELRLYHPTMHANDATEAARKAYAYGRGKGALAAMWIFEKHHRFGAYELIEMTFVPLINMLRGLARGQTAPLRVQSAMLRGRYRGFWQYITRRSP